MFASLPSNALTAASQVLGNPAALAASRAANTSRALDRLPEPMTTAGHVAFWARLHQRLAKLANCIGADEQGKILGAVHARIPMVTIDELRALQRENAEAAARL